MSRRRGIVWCCLLAFACVGAVLAPGPTSQPEAEASLEPVVSDRSSDPAPPSGSERVVRELPRPEARRLHVALTGDVLVHTGVWQTAERMAADRGMRAPYFTPMFAGIAPAVRAADLAVCHLETPVSPRGGPYLNYPVFAAPPEVVRGLAETGYDGCTTASNHAVDQGFTGLARTIRTLRSEGLFHAGTHATETGSRGPTLVSVRGVRVGLLSVTYGTNGLPVAEPWSVDLIDVPRVLAQARALRRAGAEVVMVAVHAGDEYSHVPNALQREVFGRLTASPWVDFVYGHHAHVVQPWARLHDKWVVYGLGNLVAEQLTELPDTYRSMLAEITFAEQPDGTFRAVRPRYRPLLITRPDDPGGTHVLDAVAALADPRTPAVLRSRLRDAVREVDAVASAPGVTSPGSRGAAQ